MGWGGRLMESIKGVLVGVVLFLASFVVLFWNEGRAVKTAKALEEGAGAVVSVQADPIDAANEGKLVHMTGEATTEETLTDPDFGVSAQAIKLARKVEMYQWKETKQKRKRKKLGGGTRTETTYNYNKTWSERLIKSSSFGEPKGHQNPTEMAYQSTDTVAQKATVGAFRLSDSLTRKVGGGKRLNVEAEMLPEALKEQVKAAGGTYYVGPNPATPTVGDLRISFTSVEPTTVSLIAQQVGETFQPYKTEVGRPLEFLKTGSHTADQMFEAAMEANVAMTWGVRLLGFILMAVGLGLIANPLVVLADVIPFLGNLLGLGVALFAGAIALFLSLVTVAIAWIFCRPLLGIGLIAVAVAVVAGLVVLAKGRKAQAPAAQG